MDVAQKRDNNASELALRMIKALVTDFSKVLLLAKDNQYTGGLNALDKKLSANGEYDFLSHFSLNYELLAFYKILSEKIDIYVFTTGYIQENPALESPLEGIVKEVFSCARLGLNKSAVAAYQTITEKIGLQPQQVLYIDDKQENVDVAKEAGLQSILYESNDQVMKAILAALRNT